MGWEGGRRLLRSPLRLLARSSRVRSRARWQHVLRIGGGGPRAGQGHDSPAFSFRLAPAHRRAQELSEVLNPSAAAACRRVLAWRKGGPSSKRRPRPCSSASKKRKRGGGRRQGQEIEAHPPFPLPLLSWFPLLPGQFERSAVVHHMPGKATNSKEEGGGVAQRSATRGSV